MNISILTIFPEMFQEVFRYGILGRAVGNGLAHIHISDLRKFAQDARRTVDDRPYGGGAGMVMKPEPICAALDSLTPGEGPGPHAVLLSPQGRLFTQRDALRWASLPELALICGRYEGVDERIAQYVAKEEVSIGDFVLSGGELPAMLLIDAVLRLLPGVVGNEESVAADSFSAGLLGHPSYTRPPEFRGWRVPDVLLSGDHEKIHRWRTDRARDKTRRNRPDIWKEQLETGRSMIISE